MRPDSNMTSIQDLQGWYNKKMCPFVCLNTIILYSTVRDCTAYFSVSYLMVMLDSPRSWVIEAPFKSLMSWRFLKTLLLTSSTSSSHGVHRSTCTGCQDTSAARLGGLAGRAGCNSAAARQETRHRKSVQAWQPRRMSPLQSFWIWMRLNDMCLEWHFFSVSWICRPLLCCAQHVTNMLNGWPCSCLVWSNPAAFYSLTVPRKTTKPRFRSAIIWDFAQSTVANEGKIYDIGV